MYFDRIDITCAYYCLENDYNINGILRERGRPYSVGVQLNRMYFKPGHDVCYETLTENGQAIYDNLVQRYGLPVC